MAILRIPEEKKEITEFEKVRDYLKGVGIDYEKWVANRELSAEATSEEILDAYSEHIERLKNREGYTTADVINLNEGTPGLQDMLEKFNKEHWHDEDEVRYTISGRGIFHVNPKEGHVISIEVGQGDLLRIPRGTQHWFDLCGDKHIRAIRLFQNISGWTPYYTESGVSKNFQPVCMGPSYFPHDSPGQ